MTFSCFYFFISQLLFCHQITGNQLVVVDHEIAVAAETKVELDSVCELHAMQQGIDGILLGLVPDSHANTPRVQ